MNEIIIKTDTQENLIATAATFFQAKKKLEHELEMLSRVENFYSKELNEVRNLYHTTKDGKVIPLNAMEDSHLLNTAVLMSKVDRFPKFGDYRDKKGGPANKYINEIKKRGLANQFFSMLDAKAKQHADEPDLDELNQEEFLF